MKLKGGFTNYGQDVGVLMLDTQFPRPRGDIGNALSFDFPVRYKIVKGAISPKIMGHEPEKELLEPFIRGARELEREGVRAITTSCGFLAPFQKQLAGSVGIAVFASSLIQAPLIRAMLPPSKKIGIFTERAEYLNERHFNGVGWSSNDIPIHVKGMKKNAVFPSVYIGDAPELETEVLKAEMIEMTEEFVAECPDAGAILLECTNMCPFSSHIRRVSGLPVFDINTMIGLFHHAMNPTVYLD